uniref:hypothetical protein n=1 Tax=Klebsiella sp. TaxID=576 RepID=UPI0031D338AB
MIDMAQQNVRRHGRISVQLTKSHLTAACPGTLLVPSPDDSSTSRIAGARILTASALFFIFIIRPVRYFHKQAITIFPGDNHKIPFVSGAFKQAPVPGGTLW